MLETRERNEIYPGWDDRPTLDPDSRRLVSCFWQLHRGRAPSNGFSSFHARLEIPAIESLYRFLGLSGIWTPGEFLDLIQAADESLIAFDIEQAEAQTEKAKKKTND